MDSKKQYYSVKEALEAMQRYCVIQDRCQSEVRTKLLERGIYGDELEQIIAELIAESFLDEERFAIAYVSGKLNINLWGKVKIKQGLKAKDISDFCIQSALKTIDEDIYILNATKILRKKIASLKIEKLSWKDRSRVLQYMFQKGYETTIVNDLLNRMIEED